MSVIGTAGHVDHGKSTLLQAITGRDPDRWAEEKRRGLTIDLGFVWTRFPSGEEVSFVDVPGHERFIKNMLAGIEAIDVALFVVAADEGWMPQSEEHLAVLDLLGLERAVVALTKVDRVDDDLVELATLEVLENLEGTTLEGAPVVAVSAVTGRGVGEVVAALDAALPRLDDGSDPRLWVDRRFSIAGAGTVVTGTLLDGPLAVGDTLMPYPGDTAVRIRGIESHEQAVERVQPRRRVALNLVGASESLGRGVMLGREGAWLHTDRFTAFLRPARYVDDLEERGAYHVHTGTAVTAARLRQVDSGALISLAQALPLRYGDRFILRETGRRAVVGGGVVLDPGPPLRGRALRASAAIPTELSADQAADALLGIRGVDQLDRLRAHTGAAPSAGRAVGDRAVTRTELDRLSRRAVEETDEYHRTTPLRPGLPLATLASRLAATPEMTEAAVDLSADLVSDGTVVSRRGHTVELDDGQLQAWNRARQLLADAGLQPPRASELGLSREVIHGLIRADELVGISEELVYLPDDAQRLRTGIAGMADGFTVAEFRDALGLSRKYAVPILEWADSQGLTRRRGDVRSPVPDA
ncbi:MAG TPA: selenocysteine-specific translation elongation factor [Acidimicrobiia bacterium]|nr:selenocysteine-specific translation elongation factor [Acidimicrobiia bacterium]